MEEHTVRMCKHEKVIKDLKKHIEEQNKIICELKNLVDTDDICKCKNWNEAVELFEKGIRDQIIHNLMIMETHSDFAESYLINQNKQLICILKTKIN